MFLKINEWKERLGNNMIQLKNVILIALYYKYNIKIPFHKFFNKRIIILYPINKNLITNDIIDMSGGNFFDQKNFNIKCFKYKQNYPKMIAILQNLFTIKCKNLNKLNNDELVIHIRSGDLFTRKRPHPNYILPPLSYYVNIINQNSYKKIYLVAQDTKNPCINKLLKIYPKIVFKLNTLETDIKIIMRAQNIVCSFGSFIPNLILLSTYTTKIYKVSYDFSVKYKTIPCTIVTDLTKYKKLINKWKNTQEQRDLMLTYDSNIKI